MTISSQAGKQAIALGVMLNVADYGDAPTAYGNVAHLPVLGWNGGTLGAGTNTIFPNTNTAPTFGLATQIPPTTALLGSVVDVERTSQANATATADDANSIDDEDGVTMPASVMIGNVVTLPVAIGAAGLLSAWFDWNRDGDFADAGEQITSDNSVSVGTTNLSVTVPTNAVAGTTFARFRICTAAASCNSPTGVSPSGEVEDYSLVVMPTTADLNINKTGPSTVVQGSLATYTITVWNKGPGNSTGATISDPVPSNLTNVNWTCAASDTAACGIAGGSGNTINFVSGILPVNASATAPISGSYLTLTVTGTATTSGTLINTASVTAAPGTTDPVPGNNSSSQSTTVTAAMPVQPAINLKKYVRNVTTGTAFSETSTTARPKDIIEYCITYINAGGNAANFKLTDNVPAGMIVQLDAYAAGQGILWNSTSNTVSGNTTPAGTNLTNAPSDDAGTLTGADTLPPIDFTVHGTNNTGLLTLDLSATGLANLGKGTVCFRTQIP
ncbi:GEVED domain-containing protein [Deinococcus puniceus]